MAAEPGAEHGAELPEGPEEASVALRRPQDRAEFSEDQCTDLAAALTYYAVLALFPAAARRALAGRAGRPGPEDRRRRSCRSCATLGASSAANTLEPDAEAADRHPERRAGPRHRARWARSGRPRATSARSAGR